MSFENELIKITGRKNCLKDEPMKKHITFKVGGPASYYVTPESDEQLIEIVRQVKKSREEGKYINDQVFKDIVKKTSKKE